MTHVIYIAGPIGNGHTVDPRTMYKNVRQAEQVMLVLMQKGWSVICPHPSYYPYLNWDAHVRWNRWMEQDYELLQKADAMFYMSPEKYGDSKGAAQELEWAKAQNKLVFTDLEQVPEVKPEIQVKCN